jgi:hypothetical protein
MFVDQADALRSRGHATATVSDEVIAGLRPLGQSFVGETVIYRGWMLNARDYRALHNAITRAGGQPLTSPAEHLAAHHLPNWYPLICELTPETRIFSAQADLASELRTLNWGEYFLKDFVKSLKTSRGSIIRHESDLPEFLAEMRRVRGEIEGGICVRRVEQLEPETERRFFVLRGKPFAPDASGEIPAAVRHCAGQIPSPFFSVDVALRADGVERVVEVGDGQVSDLVGWSADRFAAIWA